MNVLIRSLAVLALLLTPVAPALTGIGPAQAQSQQIAVAELMRATALDEVFTRSCMRIRLEMICMVFLTR